MNRVGLVYLIVILMAVFTFQNSYADGHRIGAGANYWTSLEDIDEDFDEDGLSYLISYQYKNGLFGLELDVESFPDRFGTDVYAPQAYLFIGEGLYAGVGIGILNVDDEFVDDPFYAVKGGIDITLFGSLHLDISANYRFNETADFDDSSKDVDTDTIFLGAAIRLEF